jgi:hypothetical protein
MDKEKKTRTDDDGVKHGTELKSSDTHSLSDNRVLLARIMVSNRFRNVLVLRQTTLLHRVNTSSSGSVAVLLDTVSSDGCGGVLALDVAGVADDVHVRGVGNAQLGELSGTEAETDCERGKGG